MRSWEQNHVHNLEQDDSVINSMQNYFSKEKKLNICLMTVFLILCLSDLRSQNPFHH